MWGYPSPAKVERFGRGLPPHTPMVQSDAGGWLNGGRVSELVGERIAQGLMLWALACLGGALLGLWRTQDGFWRPFWFMTGVLSLIHI